MSPSVQTGIVGAILLAVILWWELRAAAKDTRLTWTAAMRQLGKNRFVLVIVVWLVGYLMGHFWGCPI